MDNENNYVKVFDEIPGRVTAAMGFLCHCKQITDPCCPDSAVQNARPLTASEQATADAALGLLRSYFLGDADLGGPPVLRPLCEPCDEPKAKADETSGCEEPKPTLSSRMVKWLARWPWVRR